MVGRAAIGVVAVAALVAGCRVPSGEAPVAVVEVTQTTAGVDPTIGEPAAAATLAGRTFSTTTQHGADVVRIEVRFAGDRVEVTTPDCRTDAAPFRTDGDRLVLDAPFAVPLADGRTCAATLRALHDRVVDQLAATPIARVQANALFLITTNRTVALLLA